MRVMLNALVYRKALRLKSVSAIIGDIVTIQSSHVQRVVDYFDGIPLIPMTIITILGASAHLHSIEVYAYVVPGSGGRAALSRDRLCRRAFCICGDPPAGSAISDLHIVPHQYLARIHLDLY